jgi:hypothetical protein
MLNDFENCERKEMSKKKFKILLNLHNIFFIFQILSFAYNFMEIYGKIEI